MAQEHLAVANACMLRRVTSREAWSRSTTVYPLNMIATTLPPTIVSIIVRLAASEPLLVIRHQR